MAPTIENYMSGEAGLRGGEMDKKRELIQGVILLIGTTILVVIILFGAIGSMCGWDFNLKALGLL
jgi:hypothetical protein